MRGSHPKPRRSEAINRHTFGIEQSPRQMNADCLAKHFRSILEVAGLPRIRLYDLRHTAATLALAVGVSPKVVSEQLGHASTAFTLDTYARVLPHMQGEAATKWRQCSLSKGAWSLTEHLLFGTRYPPVAQPRVGEIGCRDCTSFNWIKVRIESSGLAGQFANQSANP